MDMVPTVDDTAARKLRAVPLSNDSVARCIWSSLIRRCQMEDASDRNKDCLLINFFWNHGDDMREELLLCWGDLGYGWKISGRWRWNMKLLSKDNKLQNTASLRMKGHISAFQETFAEIFPDAGSQLKWLDMWLSLVHQRGKSLLMPPKIQRQSCWLHFEHYNVQKSMYLYKYWKANNNNRDFIIEFLFLYILVKSNVRFKCVNE